MYDIEGEQRIRMRVPKDGPSRLEFLDEAGKVVYSLLEVNETGQE